jgi:hypothetical protein
MNVIHVCVCVFVYTLIKKKIVVSLPLSILYDFTVCSSDILVDDCNFGKIGSRTLHSLESFKHDGR